LMISRDRGSTDGRTRSFRKEQEDALCMYETAKYEVVRVDIGLNSHGGGRVMKGCTFLFAGEEHELD
jgi:hypothetical protein